MPRNPGTGVYEQPAPDVITTTTIESTVYNGFVNDVETDLNAPRPIVAGGTGANNATQARDNLKAEVRTVLVTNFDTQIWESGSFYTNTSPTGGPVAGHAFTGTAQVHGDPQHITITARDIMDTVANPGRSYARQRLSGVWGPWRQDNVSFVTGSSGISSETADMFVGLTGTSPGSSFIVNSESDATGVSLLQVNRTGATLIKSPMTVQSVGTTFAALTLDAGNGQSDIFWNAAGAVPSWLLRNDGTTGNFNIFRYVGGTLSGSPLGITKSDGTVTIGTLSVAGTGTFTGLLTANGGVTVNGSVSVSSLGVAGNATVGGTTTLTGLLTANGGLAVNGSASVSSLGVAGNATVGGTTTLTGLLTANGGLAVNGSTSTSSLGVAGAATVGTTLGVTGNTTIGGTTTTKSTLNIDSTGAGNNPSLILRDQVGTIAGYYYWDRTLDVIGAQHYSGTSLLIGAGGLQANHNACNKPAGGPWGTISDERIKVVHGDYQHGLEQVLALHPVIYSFNQASMHKDLMDKQFVGLIAQEAEVPMPEMVTQGEGLVGDKVVTDLRTLDTGPLIYALVNAVKTLTARIEALEVAQAPP